MYHAGSDDGVSIYSTYGGDGSSIGYNLNMSNAQISKIATTYAKCNINQISNRTLAPTSSGISQETLNQSVGSSRANSLPRPISPSPSVVSDKNVGDVHVSRKYSTLL